MTQSGVEVAAPHSGFTGSHGFVEKSVHHSTAGSQIQEMCGMPQS
jgi:hypothetical protein